MKRSNFFKKIILISFGLILLLSNYKIMEIKADDNADFENALATTPKGLAWNSDAFTVANFADAYANRKANGTNLGNSSNDKVLQHASRVNNAQIVKSTNPNNPNTSVIQMTNKKYQTGAVWSTLSNDNYFDISHEQTASMWLYLGKIDGGDPGDGMAFVLQNDPNGENAIALSSDGIPVNGQSLGVWGADWNLTNDYPTNLSKTAIQNSWALEFDTFSNFETQSITGEGNSFDSGIVNLQTYDQHIAAAYPALPSTYDANWTGKGSYYVMNHQQPKIFNSSTPLVDSSWHHVTIKWTPISSNQGTLSYAYNDKDASTGAPLKNATKVNYNIDTTKFGLTGDNKKLYWGFTGSTGSRSENNLLVFESIPSFVDAEAKSSVYDDSKGGVQITNSSYKADPYDDIRYTYSLNYKGWTKKWDNINALMNVPENVNFTSGTVTYPDSPYNKKPRPIPPEVFENIKNNQLQYKLPEALDSDSRNAQIELKGKTTKLAPNILQVPSAHASFEGDNLITGTDTQAFQIAEGHLAIDSDTPNVITIGPNDTANISGQVYYDKNKIDINGVHMFLSINGGAFIEQKDTLDVTTGKFNIPIPADQLQKVNTVSIQAQTLINGSNILKRQINVGGLLAFGNIQDKVNFQSTNGSYGDKIIPRSDHWQIEVTDSREKGSTWRVQAQLTKPMINGKDNSLLKGNLFYRNPSDIDKDLTLSANSPVTVATHVKNVDGSETKNITDPWTSNSGILLSMKNGNTQGVYGGQISWSLLDSI